MIYEYGGAIFPEYLKKGNATQFIAPIALQFCKGKGLDIGASEWPLQGAIPWELKDGCDGMKLPDEKYDFIFASHSLEHLPDPIAALEHWKDHLRPGAPLYLHLPSMDMLYWRTSRNRKHLHEWTPEQMAWILSDIGFVNVLHSQRDMYWSFSVVGWNL